MLYTFIYVFFDMTLQKSKKSRFVDFEKKRKTYSWAMIVVRNEIVKSWWYNDGTAPNVPST